MSDATQTGGWGLRGPFPKRPQLQSGGPSSVGGRGVTQGSRPQRWGRPIAPSASSGCAGAGGGGAEQGGNCGQSAATDRPSSVLGGRRNTARHLGDFLGTAAPKPGGGNGGMLGVKPAAHPNPPPLPRLGSAHGSAEITAAHSPRYGESYFQRRERGEILPDPPHPPRAVPAPHAAPQPSPRNAGTGRGGGERQRDRETENPAGNPRGNVPCHPLPPPALRAVPHSLPAALLRVLPSPPLPRPPFLPTRRCGVAVPAG